MYKFPVLETIDAVFDAINGRTEFYSKEYPEYNVGIVTYMVVTPTTFLDPETAETPEEHLRRALSLECRGIRYDLTTRKIVGRPYHKFKNIGESKATQPHEIFWGLSHRVLEKLDGSMVSPFYHQPSDKVIMFTKRGISDVANAAAEWVENEDKYRRFCITMQENDITPIFEWIDPTNQIILNYGSEYKLILTALRNNHTGEYAPYEYMEAIAQSWGLDVVDVIYESVDDIDEFTKAAYALEDTEGFVIRFDDGHMYKVKCDWYVKTSNVRQKLVLHKDVVSAIVDEKLDDIIPRLPKNHSDRLEEFQAKVNSAIVNNAKTVLQLIKDGPTNKAEFASWIKAKDLGGIAEFTLSEFSRSRTEEEIIEKIKEKIRYHSVNGPRLEKNGWMIGGEKWVY